MKVYIAIQKGVYRHNVLGTFTSMEAAAVQAKTSLKEEEDHYHNVEIVESELDEFGTPDKIVETFKWIEKRNRNDGKDAEAVTESQFLELYKHYIKRLV